MRLFFIAAALAGYLGSVGGSQHLAPTPPTFRLTDPRTDKCALWTSVEQLARRARLRIGFEAIASCDPGQKILEAVEPALTFEGMSPAQALDALLQLTPEFASRKVDGTIVIRPIVAWNDRTDPLNRAVGPFVVSATHPHFAVHAALEAAQPPLLMPHTDLGETTVGLPLSTHVPEGVALQFNGGTLLQGLNAVVNAFEGMWQVGYTGKTFHVVLHSFDFQEASSSIPGRVW